jgi:lantibiotic biosynthesis protein
MKAFSEWHTTIDASLRNYAFEAIYAVAERLCEPDNVVAVAQAAAQQSTFFSPWRPTSLSCGFSSTALLFLYLSYCFPGQGWEAAARLHLRLAAEETHRSPFISPGLFSGSSGMATVISFFRKHDNHYQKSWKALNDNLITQVLEMQWLGEQIKEVRSANYDIISGVSGILGYLTTIERPDDHTHTAIHKSLEYLIRLAGNEVQQERRHWFLAPEFYPVPFHLESYPDGYFNCGLAHGIPGPLAALAVAWHANYRLPGQREAILSLGQWIIEHQLRDSWGVNWPSGVPLEASYSSEQWSTLPPSRDGWCYGSPGIARALWLAGTALNDTIFCQTALEAIESVLRRPVAMRAIPSATFCHGIAGLLTICLRFAHETDNELVHQHIPILVQQLLSEFNPRHALGFRNQETANNWVDDPGLLTGGVGVALALLAASTSIEPTWDRIFLIS